MPIYNVKITCLYGTTVSVEAESEDEAIEKLIDDATNGECPEMDPYEDANYKVVK